MVLLLTDNQTGLVVAFVALIGTLGAAGLPSLFSHQAALRDADLLERLERLGMEEEAAAVRTSLSARIKGWSTRWENWARWAYVCAIGIYLIYSTAIEIAKFTNIPGYGPLGLILTGFMDVVAIVVFLFVRKRWNAQWTRR